MNNHLINKIISGLASTEVNILLLLGFALFSGILGGKVFQKLKIPQVVGYITIGIIIGQSGMKIVDEAMVKMLEPFSYFALGLIGFMIGGELKREVFKKFGKQFITILLWEGLVAFFLVFFFVGTVGMFFFAKASYSWALALLLGAIASATAPAATTDVLWENKTRGPLTTIVLGIVALDDALALLLFAAASSIASKLIGASSGNTFSMIMHPVYEIAEACFIGGSSGFILSKVLERYTEKDKILALSLGMVLFVLGISIALKIDMLLSAMMLGTVIVNFRPRMSKELFSLVESFSAPIYVLFFVLLGAKLNIKHMSMLTFVLAFVYLLGRTAGKMAGARFGAILAHSPKAVISNLPLCLFSQAGVAIGLSLVAAHIFPNEVGNTIIIVITTTTFIVQLLGPVFTKIAVTKAGEVGLDITEEDIIKKTKVSEIMDEEFPYVYEDMPLTEILSIFSDSAASHFCVVDKEQRLLGVITIDNIKKIILETSLSTLFLAYDIMDPVTVSISPENTLFGATELLGRYRLEYLPVIDENKKVKGILERVALNRFVSMKIFQLQKQAEELLK